MSSLRCHACNKLIIKIYLINKSGVLNLLLLENHFNGKISLSSLPQGIYMVKIYTEKGMAISKVMKE